MSKGWIIAIIVIVLIIVGFAYWASQMAFSPSTVASSTYSASASSSPSSSNVLGASTTGELFADSPYLPYAYLISTSSTQSASTTKALNGFQLQKSTNADGSVQVMLVAKNPEYQSQSYLLEPGDQLYFIEKTLGDDSGGKDSFPGDDSAVLVDPNGYILQIGTSSAAQGKG